MDKDRLEILSIALSDNKFPLAHAAMVEDVFICQDKLKAEDNQFWRRMFLRAFFSFVEGHIYQMRQKVLHVNSVRPLSLSLAELVVLEEKEYRLNQKGEIEAKDAFGKLSEGSVPFIYEIYFRVFGGSNPLPREVKGWSAFIEAIRIRNRITHPKSHTDMDITASELKQVKLAVEWFQVINKNIFATLLK